MALYSFSHLGALGISPLLFPVIIHIIYLLFHRILILYLQAAIQKYMHDYTDDQIQSCLCINVFTFTYV